MENILYFLVLILLLVSNHTKSTFSLRVADLNTLEKTDPSQIDITLHDAKKLCQKVDESRIQSGSSFMWIEVKSVEESIDEPKILTADCFRVRFVKCVGQSRYPISSRCGFFTLVPEPKCSSAETGIGIPRSRRSTPSKKISLSHSRAVQLCSSLQNLPQEFIPLQIEYVPIKLSVSGVDKSATLGDECVRWANEACDEAESEEQTDDCSMWKLILHSTEKCAHLSKFYKMSNSSLVAKQPNPMHQKTDLLHSTEVKPENRAYGTDIFADVVECKSEGTSVNCHVTPKPKRRRSKIAAKNDPTLISRVERQCCSLFRCYKCRGIQRDGQNCDCSAFDPDGVCSNLGVCDNHEYPGGCYGDCDSG